MTRPLTIAGAQLGPIELGHSRAEVVERLLVLLRDRMLHKGYLHRQRNSSFLYFY